MAVKDILGGPKCDRCGVSMSRSIGSKNAGIGKETWTGKRYCVACARDVGLDKARNHPKSGFLERLSEDLQRRTEQLQEATQQSNEQLAQQAPPQPSIARSATAFCTQCGAQRAGNDQFCGACGAGLAQKAAAARPLAARRRVPPAEGPATEPSQAAVVAGAAPIVVPSTAPVQRQSRTAIDRVALVVMTTVIIAMVVAVAVVAMTSGGY